MCLPPKSEVLKKTKKIVKKVKAKRVFVATDNDPMIKELTEALKSLKVAVLFENRYSRRSLSGHSRKRTAGYLRPPWQNPVWTLTHTNSVCTHSRKRPAPVADSFSAFRGCPLTGASTVITFTGMGLRLACRSNIERAARVGKARRGKRRVSRSKGN